MTYIYGCGPANWLRIGLGRQRVNFFQMFHVEHSCAECHRNGRAGMFWRHDPSNSTDKGVGEALLAFLRKQVEVSGW